MQVISLPPKNTLMPCEIIGLPILRIQVEAAIPLFSSIEFAKNLLGCEKKAFYREVFRLSWQ